MAPSDPDTLRIPAFQRKKMLAAKAKSKTKKVVMKKVVAKKPAPKKLFVKKPVLKLKPKMKAQPKILKKPMAKKITPKLQPVGKITHYYDRIHVGVLKLSTTLRVGDRLQLKGKKGEFEQVVKSMQIEHESVTEAKKGADLGLKVDQEVRPDQIAYRIS